MGDSACGSLSNSQRKEEEMLKKISQALFDPFFDQCAKELRKEIVGSCDSILDVGCGGSSPISLFSADLRHAVGVDGHAPSIARSREAGIHHEYHQMSALDIGKQFPERSFDCVLLCDLVEHLPKAESLRLIAIAERIAKKKVIIFTPNGFLRQGERDENPYQVHVCGWEVDEMKQLGYHVIGINGWKPLRTEEARIAWWPRFFWGKVSLLTQPLVLERPEWAFHLFCVKKIV